MSAILDPWPSSYSSSRMAPTRFSVIGPTSTSRTSPSVSRSLSSGSGGRGPGCRPRSALPGLPSPVLVAVGRSPRRRAARHRGPLASFGLPPVLALAISPEAPRPAPLRPRAARPHSPDGSRETDPECPTDPWRAADVRLRRRGEDGVSDRAEEASSRGTWSSDCRSFSATTRGPSSEWTSSSCRPQPSMCCTSSSSSTTPGGAWCTSR